MSKPIFVQSFVFPFSLRDLPSPHVAYARYCATYFCDTCEYRGYCNAMCGLCEDGEELADEQGMAPDAQLMVYDFGAYGRSLHRTGLCNVTAVARDSFELNFDRDSTFALSHPHHLRQRNDNELRRPCPART